MEDSKIVELYLQKNENAIKETDNKHGAYCFTEPIAKIAKKYGLTENNIMVILSRTRKKLKKFLIEEGFWDE